MKKLGAFIIILLGASFAFSMSVKSLKSRAPTAQENQYPYLEFLDLKQFLRKDKKNFELSGLAMGPDNTVYTISDKERNHYIYTVDWKKGKINEDFDFQINDKLDIEAIDICGDTFYLSNEKTDKFYYLKKGEKSKKISPDYSTIGMRSTFMNGNRGFEGMAIDCQNQIMYATKERQPRFILTIDLKTEKILRKWDIPETDAFDYSDAKFQNGFLYVLERTGMLVTKINPKTGEVVGKYSYQNIEKSYGYLFGPAIHPFAEALLLTSTEIWIGFDNNGLRATHTAEKDLGIKNRDPLIVRFKRPENF